MTRRLKLFKIAIVLLALGSVAAAAAPLVWRLRGHNIIIPPTASLATRPADDIAPINVDPVLLLSPFGAVAVAQAETSENSAQPLNLTLLGVIVRDDPARSVALIGTAGGEANYRIGDSITDDVILTDVSADFVMLNVRGTARTLRFDGAAETDEPDAIPTGEDRLAAIMAVAQGPTISERNDAAQRAVPVTTHDYIDMWRDRIIANPAEVMDAIGLVSVENGYMITEEHDSGVNRAGLKAGDIVTSLNGQLVGDIESDRALYDQVAQSGLARIEVQRNGRTIVMSFPLQ